MVDRKKDSREENSRFWEKISLVAEISENISGNVPDRESFKEILIRIQEIIPFHSATLAFFDHDRKNLEDYVVIGEKVEPIDFVQFELGFGFSAWVANQNKPVLMSNIRSTDRPPEKAIGSFLVIPMMTPRKPLGVVNFSHPAREFFRDTDVKLLSILVSQIGIAAERAFYQQALEEQNKELVRAQEQLRLAQQRLISDERLSAVRELSVSINHEINNPLSVIIGNIQCLLFIEKGLDERIVKRLKKIENEAMRIADLNRQLLKIDDLVTETYIGIEKKIKMINIEKSISKG